MEGHAHSKPFEEAYLDAGDIHKIYYCQYGKQDGKPGKAGIPSSVSRCRQHAGSHAGGYDHLLTPL